MARTRLIKPGFFSNDVLAECDPLARLLFAGLWTIVDRDGRTIYRPARIKAQVLPYDACDIEALMRQLADRGFVQVYAVDGTAYLSVTGFSKHQNPHAKEASEDLPEPPTLQAVTESRVISATSTGLSETSSGDSGTSRALTLNPSPFSLDPSPLTLHSSDTCVARSKRRVKPADPLSWNPDEEWIGITDGDRADWAEAFPAVDIDAKLKGLTLWLKANPKKAKKSRWRAWLLGRLREEQDRGGSASKPQVSRNQAADKPQTREQYRPFNAPEDCDPSEYHRFRTPDGRPCSPSIYLTKGGRKRFITGEWYDDVIGKPPALPPAQTADEIALFGKISPRRDRQTDVA
jgi:hypothetical protein